MAAVCVTIEQAGAVALAVTAEGAPLLPAEGMTLPGDPDAAAKIAEADPLTIRAREYATGSLRVLQALRPRLMRRSDSASLDAADRLEETCITVASKIHRAVSSAFSSGDAETNVQNDANGSAKVALLLIEESRQAWRVLMRPGFAVGNGAPAGFIETLDRLEAGLHARFPRALEFVRPGFDTGAESGIEWSRALSAGPGTTRH